MEPGRELDAVVSGLIGLDPSDWPWECYVEKHSTDEGVWCYCCVMNVREGDRVPPPYSTDIAAAWDMLDAPVFAGHHFEVGRAFNLQGRAVGWYARVANGPIQKSSTAPHAICLAALKAVVETP